MVLYLDNIHSDRCHATSASLPPSSVLPPIPQLDDGQHRNFAGGVQSGIQPGIFSMRPGWARSVRRQPVRCRIPVGSGLSAPRSCAPGRPAYPTPVRVPPASLQPPPYPPRSAPSAGAGPQRMRQRFRPSTAGRKAAQSPNVKPDPLPRQPQVRRDRRRQAQPENAGITRALRGRNTRTIGVRTGTLRGDRTGLHSRAMASVQRSTSVRNRGHTARKLTARSAVSALPIHAHHAAARNATASTVHVPTRSRRAVRDRPDSDTDGSAGG